MTRFLTFLALVLAACGSPKKKPSLLDQPVSPLKPARGTKVALYEVRDTYARDRLGIVETWKYSNGERVRWVYDKDRTERLGYIDERGRAVRLVLEPGDTRARHVDIGIDTVAVGVRKILGHGEDVVLHPITEEALGEEMLAEYKRKQGEGCGGE